MKRSPLIFCLILLFVLVAAGIPAAASPSLYSVTPSSGPNDGDVSVTIIGSGFNSYTTVWLTPADKCNGEYKIWVSIRSRSDNTMTATFSLSGKTPAPYRLWVNSPYKDLNDNLHDDVASLATVFLIYQRTAPTLTSISPSSGETNTSVSITLVGTNFGHNAGIRLKRSSSKDIIGSVTSVNSTRIVGTFNLDRQAPGDYQVCVYNDESTYICGLAFTVTSSGETAPTISGISPNKGYNTSTLSDVTVSGSGFSNNVGVVLTKKGETNITGTINSQTATSINCDLPLSGKTTGIWNVVVINANGKTATFINGFTIIGPIPIPNFTASPRSGTKVPLTVRFTDTSTKSPTSWKWTFGDNSSVNATVKNPVHTYAKVGTYNVSLEATNAYGNNTVTKIGWIKIILPPPTITAIKPSSGNWGTTVQITDLIGTGFAKGAKVYLTKTGRFPINATNISVVSPTNITCRFKIPLYAAIGPWNVRVNNTDGKSGTKVNAFMVKTPAPPTVTGITPASGTQGTTVQITYLAGTGFALDPKPTMQLVKNTITMNATNITVINPNRLTCTLKIPATATIGSWTVKVTNADGQYGTKANAFIVRALPTVITITPNHGIRGTTIQITNLSGTGFNTGAKVYLTRIDSTSFIATNVTVVSPQKITCTVAIPAGATIGPWNVTVKNTDGSSGTKVNAFTVKTPAPPTVTDITPASGIRGTTVQITNLSGTGFVLVPKPTIQLVNNANTITATNITVVNPNTMTCTFTISPYAITGPWNVKVTNADIQSGMKIGVFTVET
jgi:PKD repeat protein